MSGAMQLRDLKDRTFWLEFIKEYEQLPCLWNEKNVNYANRKIREQAFGKLLQKVRQVWPEAQQDFVKQRLNNFRRTFLNEYNKVQESKKIGLRKYVPSLFYYNHLKFLKQDDNDANQSSEQSSDSNGSHFQISASQDDFQREELSNTDYSDDTEFYVIASTSNQEDSIKPIKRQRLQAEYSESNRTEIESTEYHLEEVTENAGNFFEVELHNKIQNKNENDYPEVDISQNVHNNNTKTLPTTQVNVQDEFDIIAKRVAMHLKQMSEQQCLYAEKLLFDVCINGRLNRLTEDSSLSLLSSSTRNKNPSSN